ncbi:MAG: glycosyltransferase family 4 protein, partial [Solirubrobacterales bacterium]|nr:glycosyltransferase family 4 protein [Solirubrobacterales bacterium]
MRIAQVSPYSWSYPGGVNRHVEALSAQLRSRGHRVHVLAPFDPPDQRTHRLRDNAQPQSLSVPRHLVPLGRTVALRANGAVSNLSITPSGVGELLHELRTGHYDLIHIHEPVAPLIGWVAAAWARQPLVGTFHAYSENPLPNAVANLLGARRVLANLKVRIAVSTAAEWTARRWFGGAYRIIPNGVNLGPPTALRTGEIHRQDRLRIVFVGQPVQRKGVPVLLQAFKALRKEIPAELIMVGPSVEDLAKIDDDLHGIRALGKLDDDAKRRELELGDVLCAPSLGGESFGMVLTEGFAAGIPVVASDIPGYRDVVRDGVDGVLVPPADPRALAEALRQLWEQPGRLAELGRAGAAAARRFAWSDVASQILDVYHEAIAISGSRGGHSVSQSRPNPGVGG